MLPLPLFGLVDGIKARHRPELDEDIPEMPLDRHPPSDAGEMRSRHC